MADRPCHPALPQTPRHGYYRHYHTRRSSEAASAQVPSTLTTIFNILTLTTKRENAGSTTDTALNALLPTAAMSSPPEDGPPQFVRDSFATCGPRLFRDLSMAQSHDSANARAIPTSIKVTVPGCEALLTHVVAAFAPKTSNVVLAAHCENYFRMVITEPIPADHVPVQPFCLITVLYPSTYPPPRPVLLQCAPTPAPNFFPSEAHVSSSEPLSLSKEDVNAGYEGPGHPSAELPSDDEDAERAHESEGEYDMPGAFSDDDDDQDDLSSTIAVLEHATSFGQCR
ncbi:hypothetical protein BDZ89DRAFT_1132002 [Hymenopellis radicata]|nr:hypothetical protein BDZ89DRAFT_1132002 [Hymenopellis radicata]